MTRFFKGFAFFSLVGPICLGFTAYMYGMKNIDEAVTSFCTKHPALIGWTLFLGGIWGLVVWFKRNAW